MLIITFLVMTLFVIMSPGIDTALITKRTIGDGRVAGLQMAFGITVGSLVHTLAAALGLSALLLQSAFAFNLLKLVGAIYLIYLGIRAFLPKKEASQETDQVVRAGNKSAFREGLLSNILNPKVIVFFLTFLPQFITESSNAMMQFFLMGCTYAVLSIIWFVTYVYCLHYVREWLLSPKVQDWMEKATGIVLIGFGIKLLFTKANSV